MSHTARDSIYKLLGGIILAFGFFIFVVGIGMTIDPLEGDEGSGPPVAIVSLAFILPGLFLYLKGRAIHKKEAAVEKIVSIINAYRRIPLTRLAQDAGLSRNDTLEALTRALSLGLVQGHIDRSTDEFFTSEGEGGVAVPNCTSCGSPLDRTYLPGETVKCPACGAINQIQTL